MLIKHGNKFGVRIRATSPSIHMIRANIETEIAPIVGSEEQAIDLIAYIREGEKSEEGALFSENPLNTIWTENHMEENSVWFFLSF